MDKIPDIMEVWQAMTPAQRQQFEKEHKIILTFLLKMADEAIADWKH